ncbi:MAG: extracellular solute-binding protein [Asticcacaulis sp.]
MLALSSCAPKDNATHITVQRIFGECRANVPVGQAPLRNADGECEVVTGLLDEFEKENPDIKLKVNIAAWPGYDQLSAEYAAGDPPDITVMHMSAMPDYQSRGLIDPLDDGFAKAGINPADFTAAARQGVTIQGHVYGMPFDNWTQLWHINTALFAKAGLMKDGEPVLPHSPEEFIAQARQFRQRTSLPYIIQATANEQASYTRNLYTYLLDQHAVFFTDPKHIRLDTPEARRIVDLFRQLYAENLMTHDQDYPAAMAAFLNGQGGMLQNGTWVIGTFAGEAETPGRPLYHAYTVKPYPMLYGGQQTAYVDGHAWVMPHRQRTPAETAAVLRLIEIPAKPRLRLVAHRSPAQPDGGRRKRAIPELGPPPRHRRAQQCRPDPCRTTSSASSPSPTSSAMKWPRPITGHKTTEQALKDAQSRVNDLLFNLL